MGRLSMSSFLGGWGGYPVKVTGFLVGEGYMALGKGM